MITRQQVASVLKAARKAKGLTQLEVAKELGKSQQTIAAWESAQAQPDANTLFILCKLYGTTVDEAFGFNSNQHVTPTEMEHIKKYRTLDEHGKKAVDSCLDIEVERINQERPKQRTHIIRKAARNGKYEKFILTDEEYEELKQKVEGLEEVTDL